MNSCALGLRVNSLALGLSVDFLTESLLPGVVGGAAVGVVGGGADIWGGVPGLGEVLDGGAGEVFC